MCRGKRRHEVVWVKNKQTSLNGSTIKHSRRLDDFGRPPAATSDLPTHDADRDGATNASVEAKVAKRVVRTEITRILFSCLWMSMN